MFIRGKGMDIVVPWFYTPVALARTTLELERLRAVARAMLE